MLFLSIAGVFIVFSADVHTLALPHGCSQMHMAHSLQIISLSSLVFLIICLIPTLGTFLNIQLCCLWLFCKLVISFAPLAMQCGEML